MLPENIAARISPEPNSGCWLWAGNVDPKGYGRFRYRDLGQLAHRVVYILLRGRPPVGLELDHKCRVRCCVNPDHLEPVTHHENMLRSPISGITGSRIVAERLRSLTHCHRGHEFTPENTRIYRGRRNCRECHKGYSLKYYYGTLRPRRVAPDGF